MDKRFKYHLARLTEYMCNNGCTLKPLPNVSIKADDAEAQNIFGKTAYYDPASKTVVLYVSGRHPKDILRSFAHEMIHHSQNLNGEMTQDTMMGAEDPQYAQKNNGLRDLEKDAFLRGNILFRDYCDNLKYGK